MGRRSESLWSFMSVSASSIFFWGQFKVQTNLSSTSSIFLLPLALFLSHKASCYWFQLISGSQEVIGWENDSELLSEPGSIPHLLAPGPGLFFLQSLRYPLVFRCSGLAFPLTWTLRKSIPPYQPPHLALPLICLGEILYSLQSGKEPPPNLFCKIGSVHPHRVDLTGPRIVLLPRPCSSIVINTGILKKPNHIAVT